MLLCFAGLGCVPAGFSEFSGPWEWHNPCYTALGVEAGERRRMQTAKKTGRVKGFTLVEAAVVLLIITVLGTLAVPQITAGLTAYKLTSGTDDFVNIVEFARMQAGMRNRAYRLSVTLAGSTSNGFVSVDEGIGTACAETTFQSDGVAPEPMTGVRTLDLTRDHDSVVLYSVEPEGLAETQLCFKPDGRVLTMDTGQPVSPAPEGYGAGEAVFTLRLKTGDKYWDAHTRQVIIPYNGIPKVE